MFVVLEADYSFVEALAVFSTEELAKKAVELNVGEYYERVAVNPDLSILETAKKFFSVYFYKESFPFIKQLPNYKISPEIGITLVNEEFRTLDDSPLVGGPKYQILLFADTDQEALELAKQKLNERGITGVRV